MVVYFVVSSPMGSRLLNSSFDRRSSSESDQRGFRKRRFALAPAGPSPHIFNLSRLSLGNQTMNSIANCPWKENPSNTQPHFTKDLNIYSNAPLQNQFFAHWLLRFEQIKNIKQIKGISDIDVNIFLVDNMSSTYCEGKSISSYIYRVVNTQGNYNL